VGKSRGFFFEIFLSLSLFLLALAIEGANCSRSNDYLKKEKMMKKILVMITVFASIAQAQILPGFTDLFDLAKIGQGVLMVADGINEGLEKIHVIQKEKVDVEQQWNDICTVTVSLNKSVEAFSSLLAKYDVDAKVCAPLSRVLTLQYEIINHCQDYYTDTVSMNSDFVLGAFSKTLEESTKILTQCYPFLNSLPFAQQR